MKEKSIKFSRIIPFKYRISIYLIPIASTLFLTLYNQLVCPFLDSLPFLEELRNLSIILLLQIILREILILTVPSGLGVKSLAGRFYKILTLSWFFAGLAAVGLHEILYYNYDPSGTFQTIPWVSDYPWHSHLKVLSGYWFLGGGLLSQLELTLGEKYMRKFIESRDTEAVIFPEHISSRITWGNFFYSFVPSVSLLIMTVRYAFQEKLIPVAITVEIAYIGTVFITAALLAALFYGKMLKTDTISIVNAVKKIGGGDFTVKLHPVRQDELGHIASGINKMAEGLILRERIKESFGHFVSPEIAEKFVREYSSGTDMRDKGERKKVAVLMCDIRNFSGIADKMDPSVVTAMLNNYFDFMVSAVKKNNGIIDKFIGDAVMAVFGLLNESINPTLNAVNAAIDMRAALREANAAALKLGYPVLDNGIGIHYGEVIASYLGSTDRLEFTIIGTTVNMAARLEGQARKPNPPLILSRAAADMIRNEFGVIEVGTADLKGIGVQKLYSVKTKKVYKG